MIDDVLAYSRAGRSERPAEPVDMERVVGRGAPRQSPPTRRR